MPSVKDFETPKTSLTAEDMEGNEVTLTIRKYEIKEFDDNGTKVRKPVLHFNETDKTLVCNITNLRTIGSAYGDDLDGWAGKEITLFPTEVAFGQKIVPAIRVRVAKKGGGKPAFLGGKPEFDDEIPF